MKNTNIGSYWNDLTEHFCLINCGGGGGTTTNSTTNNYNYTDASNKQTMGDTNFGAIAAGPAAIPAPCALNCPGGGGSCTNEANTASSTVQSSIQAQLGGGIGAGGSAGASAAGGAQGSGSVGAGLAAKADASAGASGGLGAGLGAGATAGGQFKNDNQASTQSGDAKNQMTCPNNIVRKDQQNHISKSLMSVDQSTMIMNQSSLSSISSAVNSMVVNKMTSTTSSSSQNVNITQAIVININNTKGDVIVKNVRNKANVSCSNTISMDITSIDNVRTDLANEVLQQFASASNTESIDAANAAIQKELTAVNSTSDRLNLDNKVAQNKSAQLPTSNPTTITPPVPGANINTDTTLNTDSTAATIISAPYTQSNSVNRSIQSSILNSVTQNFTNETVTQLITAININQTIGINVSNTVGNVTLDNIENLADVALISTINNSMDIGTSIVNSVTGNLGTKTDDAVAIKKSRFTSLSDISKLRSSVSGSTDTTSEFSYDQSFTTNMIPASGSCGSSSIFSLISIMMIFLIPTIFTGLPPPTIIESTSDSSTSDSSSTNSTPSTDSTSSTASTTSTASPAPQAYPVSPGSPESTDSTSSTVPTSEVAKVGGYYFY
jgi:hypothetical protein